MLIVFVHDCSELLFSARYFCAEHCDVFEMSCDERHRTLLDYHFHSHAIPDTCSQLMVLRGSHGSHFILSSEVISLSNFFYFLFYRRFSLPSVLTDHAFRRTRLTLVFNLSTTPPTVKLHSWIYTFLWRSQRSLATRRRWRTPRRHGSTFQTRCQSTS